MNAQTETAPNPRETIGGNNPPLAKTISEQENFAQTVTDFLADQFADAIRTVDELLAEARALPAEIDGEETKGKYTGLIKRIRDHAKRLDALHEKEGTPYLRGKQAVDQFFFGPIDKLARRDKKNRPGAADILNARLTDYDTKVLAEKQAALRREAEERERIADGARLAEAEAARVAEETRLAAERARVPERIAEKTEVADKAAGAAVVATIAAEVTADAAKGARVESLAKPADLMRQRGNDGTLSTMATEAYAEIVPGQDGQLDKEKLWPFIGLAEKEKAVRAWAKNTGHTQQMPGAIIGKRPKSVVR